MNKGNTIWQNTSAVCLVALMALAVSSPASAAVLDPTGYTRSIDLSVAGYTGSSTLSGFPVLVRLGPSVAGFRYADFADADGGDLVFTDANGNVIPHEIDTWNTNGESLVWVKLPSMAKNTSFRAYWGRMPDAANNPTAVWSGYVGVWHMGEDSGNAIDATGHGYNGVPTGDLAAGMVAYENGAVGRARVNQNGFDGKAYLSLANSGSLTLGTKFVVSGWFLANRIHDGDYPRLASRKQRYTDTNGWEFELSAAPTDLVVRGASNSPIINFKKDLPDMTKQWRYLAVSYNGSSATVYAEGVKITSGTITSATDNGCPISFGCNSNGSEYSLNGQYDEIRIAKTVPTADWALAEYRSMTVADFVKVQPVANLAELRTFHVDAANGADAANGRSWATSLATIQRAIDLACTGDEILVADGTYAPIVSGNLGVTIRSVNGAAATIIDGGDTNRCATLGESTNDVVKTTLVGFTLRNGRNMHGTGVFGGIVKESIVTGNYAGRDDDSTFNGLGGGLYYCIAFDCVITNNVASGSVGCGGGAGNCILSRCIISDNVSADDGGGAYRCQLFDCLIAQNHAQNGGGSSSGGGIYSSYAERCTIAGNTAVYGKSSNPGAAGADKSVLESCIAYGNTLTSGATSDAYSCTATYSCFGTSVSGTGNIVADPLFVDAANGDYRLQAGSPCIDTGLLTVEAKIGTDLDGHSRWIGTGTDLGCYEWGTHYSATTQYVAQATGNDANDGLSWETAKATIQNAIDWAADGDEIVVSDGVYSEGETIQNWKNAHLLIRSVNGAASTIIDGEGEYSCVAMAARLPTEPSTSYDHQYRSDFVTMVGFTLRNGYVRWGGAASIAVTLKNCILIGNVSGTVGVAYGSRLENCLLVGNAARNGNNAEVAPSAALSSILVNCTIVANTNMTSLGTCAVANCAVTNCIIVGNVAVDEPLANEVDEATCDVWHSCLDTATAGTDILVADPLFRDAANGDYRIRAVSPCVDAGDSASAAGETDLAGNSRVAHGAVDMGCYEYRPGIPVITPADGTEFGKSTQTVMITCDDPDATIHCTTDGTTPTAESSSRVKFSIRDTTTVKAVAVALGDWAGEAASATIVRVYVVGAPDGLTAEEAAGGIALTWSAVDGAASYRVYRGPSPDIAAATLLGSTDGLSWTDATAEAGQAYYYFVISENIAGVSEAGAPAIGSTLGLPTAVNMPRLVFTTGAGCPWTAETTAAAADRVHDARSGTPDDEADSWLETTVSGAGSITFKWRVSCEHDDSGERDWDHLVFLVDGEEKARIDGETGWTEASFEVAGNGAHTLRWAYVKDFALAEGDDCGWLDCVDWRPTVSIGDWEAWVDFHGIASPNGYEVLKPMPSGKDGTLWDEFVAGLNPLDPLSRFLAGIHMDADDPVVTWAPNLGGRIYTILGRASLTEGDWTPVTPENKAQMRFFKVKVEMP